MSGLPFEILIALRYLRPKRTFVSVITLISIAGVSLAVAVLIIVISVMSGFDKQMRDTMLGFNAHLTIVDTNHPIANYEKVLSIVNSNKNVTGAAPFILGQALMRTTTNEHSGVIFTSAPWVRGIDPEDESKVSTIATNVIAGDYDLHGHSLIVGSALARKMRIDVGDVVNISSPEDIQKMEAGIEKVEKGQAQAKQIAIPPMEYEVRGIFDVGYYDYDATVVITSLRNAQDMYGLGDDVHGLSLKTTDPFNAGVVRRQLESALGPQYTISTWLEDNQILSAVAVEKNVMFIILFCIMIVAALCILSALITFVVQKTREIGMLKALGASDFQVGGLFLSQSAFIGAIGVLLGLGLGILAITYRNEFLHFMRWATGLELFPESVYGFSDLPALIVPGDIALICGSAFIICIFGGVLPAWRASRLKPVEALRYE